MAGTRPHVDAVLVVDDGSTDDTAAAAEAAGAEVVRHPDNRGKGVAVRSGLAAVHGRGFTHVLLMDGDLQHRPADVPRLVAAAAGSGGAGADADVIVGARTFDRAQMPALALLVERDRELGARAAWSGSRSGTRNRVSG